MSDAILDKNTNHIDERTYANVVAIEQISPPTSPPADHNNDSAREGFALMEDRSASWDAKIFQVLGLPLNQEMQVALRALVDPLLAHSFEKLTMSGEDV